MTIFFTKNNDDQRWTAIYPKERLVMLPSFLSIRNNLLVLAQTCFLLAVINACRPKNDTAAFAFVRTYKIQKNIPFPNTHRTIISKTTTSRIFAGGSTTPQRPEEEAIFKTRPSTSLPDRPGRAILGASTTRKKKNKVQTKRERKKYAVKEGKKDNMKRSGVKPIADEEELQEHVANHYIMHGPRFSRKKVKHLRVYQKELERQRKQVELCKGGQIKGGCPVLVLNADYQPMSHLPLSLWSWQEAVKAVFNGKCTVVDVYPEKVIRTVNLDIPLPSVIALNQYVSQKFQYKQRPAFTRRNVFLRDGYKCQYCNNIFHTRDLSLDHVKPRSMGGQLNWENAVTCCLKCNVRKGCIPVEDLQFVGMKLVRKPFVPTSYELAVTAGKMLPKRVHPTWEPYLRLSSGSTIDANNELKNTEP